MKDWPHLYPHGAVIIISQKAIGVLSFTEEGMISPIFFTQETLSCKLSLVIITDLHVLKSTCS